MVTEKQKSALIDFNNFEVWSGTDSEDKDKEKSPEKPSSSKATDGQPIEVPDESTEQSIEAGSAYCQKWCLPSVRKKPMNPIVKPSMRTKCSLCQCLTHRRTKTRSRQTQQQLSRRNKVNKTLK